MTVAELIESGVEVRVAGVLVERLTPRQLRFLFASGAFGAAKRAIRAAEANPFTPFRRHVSIRRAVGQEAMAAHLRQRRAELPHLARKLRAREGVVLGLPKSERKLIGQIRTTAVQIARQTGRRPALVLRAELARLGP